MPDLTDLPAAAPPPGDETAAASAPEPEPIDPGQASLSRALNFSFLLLKVMMLAVLALFLLSCLRSVQETDLGVVRRFGRLLTDEHGAVRTFKAGRPHFVWPEPLEQLEVVRTGTDSITLADDFWTFQRAGQHSQTPHLPESKGTLVPAQDGYTLTGDFNLVHTRWRIDYAVDAEHPEDYFDGFATRRAGQTPEERRDARLDVLRLAARAAIVKVMAGLPVDDALGGAPGADPARVAPLVLDELQRMMRDPERAGRYRGGFKVERVSVLQREPPGQVKSAFNQVTEASLEADSRRIAAESASHGIRAAAVNEANRVREDARVYASTVVANAKANATIIDAFLKQAGGDPARLRTAADQHRLERLKEHLSVPRVITLPPARAGGEPTVLQIAPPADLPPPTTR